jgi:glutamate-1-semialdehyde 2,1-aminomutase
LKRNRSNQEWERAQRFLPGGVNSPVRSYAAVGGSPPFVHSGKGCTLVDLDGNEYIDYVMSWGPLILGHRHPVVMEAIRETLNRGTTFGAPTREETELAELIIGHVPSIESIRLVSSGTEAVMSALRLARGFTGRDGIVKFDGCYHGHADTLLVEAGSGAATLSIPGSSGVPAEMVAQTYSIPFNDPDAFTRLLDEKGEKIALVVVEPVPGNMGVIPPEAGFLELLRRKTEEKGILLMFDEVISGFRVGLGGVQEKTGVLPDLTSLGKVIGGGLPLGAYGGRREVMDHLAPLGPVYQAGTLSGNPVAVAAGIATIRTLEELDPYERLEGLAARLVEGIADRAVRAGIPAVAQRSGTVGSVFFSSTGVRNYEDSKRADQKLFARYHSAMLDAGVYLPPSQFEAYFLSIDHDDAVIDRTLEKAETVFSALAG